MKKSHIIGIVIIAAAIMIIMSTAGDASTYVDFGQAKELAEDGSKTKVHVVGRLKKDAEGHIVGMKYDPIVDPNYFSFMLVDTNRVEQQVVYFNPKPQDFERSEQVVITGSMQNEVFVADKILLKCPSKYVEKEVQQTTAGL
ncbi:cytochrome c maturation protein CcmE [Pontibacter sp. BT310]|jgi:cytochrome c-type biogenesis protein CcmE|uniref:Cytochrome c maturation protein CcmE n=1 Tax=Pontibacter populi TaxID=890055 RepID=A0ABS6X874_9BACT|nr:MULTISPECIES: cytochrome c maturation protein CcmE [Pontibacter]MBJ6117347.1 cytochrome c maturation protein CcmE [Pontibacter sp. BT310]MBR0569772.1 cytochrome c maturation protein CcmE [Microvirga sp. STS03]MBW3364200.1 cytochrome c maturation protein CcmE [Pontibacter populi]